MRHGPVLCALSAAMLLSLGVVAQAGVVLQPVAATTDLGHSLAFSPDKVRDQSGLSGGYISGVTDFDAYIATNPMHAAGNAHWLSAFGGLTGNFDFDLGGTFTVESLALWNIGNGKISGVRGFALLADDNAAFSSPTSLGTFEADPGLSGPPAEVFTFTPTEAAYMRLVITSNGGSEEFTGFGEAAFEVAVTPEPAALLLLGVGLAGLALRHRARTG